jgi:UDP-glucuronate decarboxylase
VTYRDGLAGQHIAVAGGVGFIGRHLCSSLLDAGATVLCIDNFLTSSREDLGSLLDRAGFTLMEADIVKLPDFAADGIFNLACPASPKAYQRDPIQTMRINVVGTDNLLARATDLGAKLVQASTSEVYGDPEVHPQTENYFGHVNLNGPRSCYDEGKRAAETLCSDYARHRGSDARIARIFNTYGPGMALDDGRIISNFVTQALRGEPISIYGDGTQTRSLCYVEDTVDGLIRLYLAPDIGPAPINIGNTDELTVAEIAAMILEATGSQSRVDHLPLPEDDPRQRRPDISRARDRLGWAPRITIDEGIARTVAHFSAVLALD